MLNSVLSRAEVRAIDQRAITEFGMSGLVLMENAGRGAAEFWMSLNQGGLIVVCAGKGNNGGDGFVIARHLEGAGHDVRVLLLANPSELSGDALTNWRILEAAETPRLVLGSDGSISDLQHHLAEANWIVDALLGTGTIGDIREPYRSAIRAINRSARSVLAVDVPSGLDCDSGLPISYEPDGTPVCVRALHTVTFVAKKRGFETFASQSFTGEVHVAGVGVPKRLLETMSN